MNSAGGVHAFHFPNMDSFFRDWSELRNAALLSGKHPIPAHLRLPISIEQLLSVVRHNVHTLWTLCQPHPDRRRFLPSLSIAAKAHL